MLKKARQKRNRNIHSERLEPRMLLAADPIISEVLASNDSTLNDGDRDSSDWIEIYNAGDEAIDLEGWYLTDDPDRLTKWSFPSENVAADAYLVVFASGKAEPDGRGNLHTNFNLSKGGEYLALVQPDGQTIATEFSPEYAEQLTDISYGIRMGEIETNLVSEERNAQLLVPTDNRYGDDWTTPQFQIDENWITEIDGQSISAAVGFETDSGFSDSIQTDVRSIAQGNNASLYVRVPFQVEDPSAIEELFLNMKYDDGYIALLNGSIIDIRNGPFFRSFNSTSNEARPNAEAAVFDRVEVTHLKNLLNAGENVLGIQLLNVSPDDDDLLLVPRITATIQEVRTDAYGYFVNPTPGQINDNQFSLGPRIEDVTHSPPDPLVTDPVVVEASVTKTMNSVGNVELVYRSMYEDEIQIGMTDDGAGADRMAADGIFTATIPAGVSDPGEMLRYYVLARDTESNAMREPRLIDTSGTDQSPEYFGTIVQDPELTSELDIFHWFAERTSRARQRSGTRVSVYFKGEFYDNVFGRQRGGATNGSSQKFNFNDDQPFYVNEKIGRVAEFNMNAQGSDTASFVRQSLAFQSYTVAGHPSSESFFMLMRDNATADRVGIFIEQVDEVFLKRQGLDPDGALYKFVQRGNLDPVFNDVTTGIEKKTRLDEGLDDLRQVVNGLTAATPQERGRSVFDNFDLANLMNYLALRSITMDADDVRKNFYGYRDTNGTGQWSIFPWDKDWTFGVTGDGGQFLEHPFFGDQAHRKDNALQWNRLYDAVFNDPVLSEMYLRRLRTLMDQMLEPPGTNPDEAFYENFTDEVFAPAAGDLPDRTNSVKNFFPARRDTLYNDHGIDLLGGGEIIDIIGEFSQAEYFVPTNNDLGLSWTNVAPPPNADQWQAGQAGFGFGTTNGFDELIKTTVMPRDACDTCTSIFVRIPFQIDDPSTIDTLSLRMKYDDGFVAYLNGEEVLRDRIREVSFDGKSTSHSNRLAVEFENFNITQHTGLLRQGDNVLAIHSVNSSASSSDQLILPVLVEGVIPDANAVGIPHAQVGFPQIQFGQFEHNPAGSQDEEYIELKNPNDTAVDISGWRVTGGIAHVFPAGTVIPAGRSMYLSPNAQAFRARQSGPSGGQGLFVQGNYQGHLSNFAETVDLIAGDGSVMDSLTTPNMPSDNQLFLRVSEVHYNPAGTSELTEFIELVNISAGDNATPLDLTGVQIVGAPSEPFTIQENTILQPGGYLVIAKDVGALTSMYGDIAPAQIRGGYVGSLSNAGEAIKINDVNGSTILDFEFRDSALWPQSADGAGGSLVVIDPANTPIDELGKNYRWRGSTEFGGNPGAANAANIPIVINEVLANTDNPQQADAIELHNTSADEVDISGWFLSDSGNDLFKFQVPANTTIAGGRYLVIDETQFNTAGGGFGLNGDGGDDVWLIKPTDQNQVAAFVDDVHFESSRPGESFARFPNAAGRLTPSSQNSLGDANADPRRPNMIISEVNYHPDSPTPAALQLFDLDQNDLEFVEIYNSFNQSINLADWRIRGGIDFEFPAVNLDPAETLVVLSFNPNKETNANRLAAFKSQYGVDDGVQLVGGYAGQLSDSQQILRLESPGAPGVDETPYLFEDEVVYDDRGPWPDADGNGLSLQRIASGSFGNDAANWSAASPTFGAFEVTALDLNADGQVDATDIDFACENVNLANPQFDFNKDGTANRTDVQFYVQQMLNTSIGDTDLNGVFDSSDLVRIFQAGEFEDDVAGNSTWAEGDWNCDGDFGTSDLVVAFQAGGYVSAAMANVDGSSIGAALAGDSAMPTPAEIRPNATKNLTQSIPAFEKDLIVEPIANNFESNRNITPAEIDQAIIELNLTINEF